jgi:hypothetical protein
MDVLLSEKINSIAHFRENLHDLKSPDLERMKYPHWSFDPKWETPAALAEELNEEEEQDRMIGGPEKTEEEILARLILKVEGRNAHVLPPTNAGTYDPNAFGWEGQEGGGAAEGEAAAAEGEAAAAEAEAQPAAPPS